MSDSAIASYIQHQNSFVPNMLPSHLVQMDGGFVLKVLSQKYGYPTVLNILKTGQYPLTTPAQTWMQKSHMVGVNVRTVGTFFGVVKYALSLPAHQDSIHLLPFWEPGVVDSLYGIASWQINKSFFSTELQRLAPNLDTVEKQLQACVGLLHLMGKKVGMDVIPHTDRFSEIVLCHPQYFEWLKRSDNHIIEFGDHLSCIAEKAIFDWWVQVGIAENAPNTSTTWEQYNSFTEGEKAFALFGAPNQKTYRTYRRNQLISFLYDLGLETVPATMAPPYRGIIVDPNPEHATTDEDGRTWVDYQMIAPQEMSRVFGPLTRYRLYRQAKQGSWDLDFNQPVHEVWDYVAEHYAVVANTFQLDFMRGDMSHVQMRGAGVIQEDPAYYDIHAFVKQHIRQTIPHFEYYAESFLAPPDYMGYGDEQVHLDRSTAEVALGNLQSMIVGSDEFMDELTHYLHIAATGYCKPCFTLMTADKDDPRFDAFYLAGNEARYFFSCFYPELPAYMGLGFESRWPHPVPVANEFYTKLYVFQISKGPKATKGPYKWSNNEFLFHRLNRIRLLTDHENYTKLRSSKTTWIQDPQGANGSKTLVWQLGEDLICLCHMNLVKAESNFVIPFTSVDPWRIVFSTHREHGLPKVSTTINGLKIEGLIFAGESLLIEKV